MRILYPSVALFLVAAATSSAVISITGVSDRTRYPDSVTFTVNGATGATLDGAPVTVGSPNTVDTIGYHELTATDATTSQTVRFIVWNSARFRTEDGIPTMVPLHFVNDAPSAFANGVLSVMAPAVFPMNLPVPVVARLTKGAAFGGLAGDPLFLNGLVEAGNFPLAPVQLRRGWGSTILPAATAAGSTAYNGAVNGLASSASITIEPATTWTNASGDLSGAQDWGANARIFLNGDLNISAGTLTIGAGTIVRCAPGVEVRVRPGGAVQVNGTTAAPVVFVPDNTNNLWGGIWLQPQSGANIARLTATGTIFCCWGADQTWFDSPPAGEPPRNFPYHREMEPCVAIAPGAVCSLTDCALVGPTGLSQTRGTAFATNGGSMLLTRTLVQRCITGGEQEDCPAFELNACAVLEMTQPGLDVDSTGFADADNDGLYLVPGDAGHTFYVNKTVVGWTKDDGIDTGASGPGRVIFRNCWFENCVHEAISNSGVERIPETHDGVHFNCGQGMECGYGGPHSLVDHCAMIGNMVGARYGDNYGNNSGSSGSDTSQYLGDITVRNSLCLFNGFHDTWAIDFSTWNFQNQQFTLIDSKVSKPADLAAQNGAEDGGNSVWDPVVDGALLAPFMPVPNSDVGVDLLVNKRQDYINNYAGRYDVRLSTFSARPVSVSWSVTGKASPEAVAETLILSGTLTFAPGETVKSISAAFPSPSNFGLIIVSLREPVNAEITGAPVWYFSSAGAPPDAVLIAKGAAGWDYQALRVEPANDAGGISWEQRTYAGTNWQTNKTAPIGFGTIGQSNVLQRNTTLTAAEQGPDTDRTITVYFRKTFSLANPVDVRALTLEFARDDAVVFYLNGTEITRNNIDSGTVVGGTISYSTLSTDTITGNDESAYTLFPVPQAFLANLVAGTNVLAAEVHQSDDGSSDLVLDAQLTASFNPPGGSTFGLASSDDQYYLYWLDEAKVLDSSSDLIQWTGHPELKSPVPLRYDQSRRYFRLP